jgi:hypothetical protein
VSTNAVSSVAVLRQALRDEIAATSLRHVSRQVGMSAAGVQKFLKGGHPPSDTRRVVERWFVLHGPWRRQSGVSAEVALATLRVMVQDLSPPRHRPTLDLLVGSLEDAYRTARLPRPAWLGDLAAELGDADAAPAADGPPAS